MRVDPFRQQPAEFLDDPGGGTMTQRDGGIAASNGGPGRDVFKGGHEGGTTAAAKLARETALRPPSVRAPATSELTQVVPLSRERMGQFQQHHVKVSDRAEPMRQTPSLVVKGPSGHGVQLVRVDALDRPEPAQLRSQVMDILGLVTASELAQSRRMLSVISRNALGAASAIDTSARLLDPSPSDCPEPAIVATSAHLPQGPIVAADSFGAESDLIRRGCTGVATSRRAVDVADSPRRRRSRDGRWPMARGHGGTA